MKPADRDPAFLALLGVVSDAEIGRQYALSRERVRQLRARLGIARPPKATVRAQATALIMQSCTSAELAVKAGCSYATAVRGIYAAGLLPPRMNRIVSLDEHIRAVMDAHPDWGDYRIAKFVGCMTHSVRRRRVLWKRPSGHKSNNPRYRS